MIPLWIYDPSEAEHLVRLVADGQPVDTKIILEPLKLLRDTLPHDSDLLRPTNALIEAFSRASLEALEIQSAWLGWIAHASAYRIYHDLPIEQEKKAATSKRNAASATGQRSRVTAALIQEYRVNFEKAHYRQPTDNEIAEKFHTSTKTIRRREGKK